MSGCKEDDKVEPEVEIFLEETRLSGRNKIVLNCKAQEGRLVTKGIRSMNHFYADGSHQGFATGGTDFTTFQRPPIYKDYLVELRGESLHLFDGFGTDFISVKLLDSTFDRYTFVSNWVNDCVLFTENDEMWIAYQSFTTAFRTRTKFLKVSLISFGNHKYEIIDPDSEITEIEAWYWLDNKLYVSNGGSAHKISGDGLTKEIIRNGIFRMFELDDVLWAISFGDFIYHSSDGGETWDLFNDDKRIRLSLFRFQNIEGRVLGYWNGQLIELSSNLSDNGTTTLTSRKINTDGMGDVDITSVAKFNGRYYVGTFNGLFSKSEANFFTYME
jgi:hypothetical protein